MKETLEVFSHYNLTEARMTQWLERQAAAWAVGSPMLLRSCEDLLPR